MEDRDVIFKRIDGSGRLLSSRTVNQSSILRCRFCIIVAEHYRDDGSCRCDDPLEQEMMIREWGYEEGDFSIG